MIIDGSTSGGGILRAAVPLSVSHQVPFEIVDLRLGRNEPGLGWPHVAVLRALEASGIIEVDGATMGSTSLSIEPAGSIAPGTHIDVNLDDPEYTFPSSDIYVERNYQISEDAFPAQALINRDGRGVRGHAVSTPLMALLPLTLSEVTLSLSGGTETPGAPFVDALRLSTLGVVNSLFGLQTAVEVQSRGPFGVGGGQVAADKGSEHITPNEERPRFMTYWSTEMADSKTPRASEARQNADRIRTLLPDVAVDYELYENNSSSVNQLLILPQTTENFARDVSLCAEEQVGQVSGDAFVNRVKNELSHQDIISRFHIEQVLLWSVVMGRSNTWRTERITPHIRSLKMLIEAATDAEIQISESADYTEIGVR